MNEKFKNNDRVNNIAYLGMLFDGYREMKYKEKMRDTHDDGRIEVDRNALRKMKYEVRLANASVEEKFIFRPVPIYSNNGVSLTQESWDKCLEYYEIRTEKLSESKPYDSDKLLELERWFIRLVEPIPVLDGSNPAKYRRDLEQWYRRETSKSMNYYSPYLPEPLRNLVGCLIFANVDANFFTEHNAKVQLLVMSK